MAPRGGRLEVMMMTTAAEDLPEESGPLGHRSTATHHSDSIYSGSHIPPLIDVLIIELSPGFSCFSSSSLLTALIVLYFTLTPFTTKDILMGIYVNILPDRCHRDREMLTPASGTIGRWPVQAN